MQIGSLNAQFRSIGPEKNKFSLGVSSIQCLKNGDLLVGCGDGRLLLLNLPSYKIKKYLEFRSLVVLNRRISNVFL